LIAFSSGEAGSFTRVLCPIFGSAFTYAAPAAIPGEPAPEATAPGQIRVNDLRGQMPAGGLSATTAIFGVVGDAVRHSLSPRVHDMALKSARPTRCSWPSVARLRAVPEARRRRQLRGFR
jgi:hypothetical protein